MHAHRGTQSSIPTFSPSRYPLAGNFHGHPPDSEAIDIKARTRIRGILGQALAVLTLTVALAGCGGSSDAGSAAALQSPAPAPRGTPVVSGTPAATVAANNRYSFQPTVANPSGTPLSFGIQNKPTWATFGETTGELSGTPAATDAGKYSNIVITANDGTTHQRPAGLLDPGHPCRQQPREQLLEQLRRLLRQQQLRGRLGRLGPQLRRSGLDGGQRCGGERR